MLGNLLIVAMFLLFLVPPAIYGQWWLFFAFLIFGVVFGLEEFLAVKWTGRSVSQKFQDFAKTHKVGKWIILGGMALAWALLLFHLGS